MGRLQLLPGEQEELRLRPAAAGCLGAYVLALLPALGGGLLWLIAHLPTWRPDYGPEPAPAWQVWRHLWGDGQALAFYAVCGIVLAAAAHYAVHRKARSFLVATGALLAMMAVVPLLSGLESADAIPLLVAALAVPALAWVELRRRSTVYLFTNLRLVVRRTMPRATETGVRHQDLVDLQAKRTLGDVGVLIPVLGKEAAAAAPTGASLRLRGVRPFDRVRALAELLVQRAAAGEYLRAEQRLEQRIAEARAGLQRRG